MTQPDHTELHRELQRIMEDCAHSAKAQFNAAARWRAYHWWLGIPAAALAATASASLIGEFPWVSATLALLAAILTALLTFLKPAAQAAKHHDSGNQYLDIRNGARRISNIHLSQLSDETVAREMVETLAVRHGDHNRASPQFSRTDFEKAREGIEEGEATYAIDKPVNDRQ